MSDETIVKTMKKAQIHGASNAIGATKSGQPSPNMMRKSEAPDTQRSPKWSGFCAPNSDVAATETT